MTTITNIYNTISTQYPEAAMVRRGNTNFLAIPMGEDEEGVMQYAKVAVSSLLSKDTKVTTAFNFEAAIAEYSEWEALQAAKANKPKKSKETDPEKEAAKQARLEALLNWVKNEATDEFTSSYAHAALSDVYAGMQVMQVGTDLNTLAKMDEKLTFEKRDGKRYWSYAE